MWALLGRALWYIGTASAGWLIGDVFNESETTSQAEANAGSGTPNTDAGGFTSTWKWTIGRVVLLVLAIAGIAIAIYNWWTKRKVSNSKTY